MENNDIYSYIFFVLFLNYRILRGKMEKCILENYAKKMWFLERRVEWGGGIFFCYFRKL